MSALEEDALKFWRDSRAATGMYRRSGVVPMGTKTRLMNQHFEASNTRLMKATANTLKAVGVVLAPAPEPKEPA